MEHFIRAQRTWAIRVQGQGNEPDWPIATDGTSLESCGLYAKCRRIDPCNCVMNYRKLAFLTWSICCLHGADQKLFLPPETAKLKAGPGADLANAQCLL